MVAPFPCSLPCRNTSFTVRLKDRLRPCGLRSTNLLKPAQKTRFLAKKRRETPNLWLKNPVFKPRFSHFGLDFPAVSLIVPNDSFSG